MDIELEKKQEVDLNNKDYDNIEDRYEIYNNNEPIYYADEEFIYKQIDICVPVSITPHAVGGVPIITQIGDVRETFGIAPCEYGLDVCSFTVCKKFCIKIPVKYTITTTYGDVCAREDLTLDDSCK